VKVVVGEQLTIKNISTGHMARIHVHEVIEYKRAFILWATMLPTGIYVPATHGRVDVPDRPSCPIIMPGEHWGDLLRFSRALNGSDLRLIDFAGEETQILNVTWPNVRITDKPHVVARAALAVDAYNYERQHHHLPPGFLHGAAFSRN